MSDPKRDGNDDAENENPKDAAVAKIAGFVVFSGIAMSIIKALASNFKNPDRSKCSDSPPPIQTPIQESKKASCEMSSTPQTIEIVKGDTLWGLSRKYGVSIDEIKEANGLTGDTIYAGKKLVIP